MATGFTYRHYILKDHLGNVRAEFCAHDSGVPELVQQTDYYPFGLALRSDDYGSIRPNRKLYGGKELQDETLAGYTLNWYDFEARMYNPAIGRFLQTDRMQEKYYGVSPYAYCLNNPLRFTDPSGEEIVIDGKEQTKNDIISIVDPKYQNRISFENNIVMVDINNLSIDEIISDAGLSLINNLSISDNRFYYETKSVDNNLGIENNSVTSRNEAGKKGDVLPEGFQGHIAMNDKNIWYDDKDNKINRCSIVFHELQENYERTEHSLPYMYLIKEYDNKGNFKRLINDSNRKGAHDTAILKAEKLTSSARSSYPEGTIHHIKKEQEYE